MSAVLRATPIRPDAFYWNGSDGLRQVVAIGPGDRVVFRDLAAPVGRTSSRDTPAPSTTTSQMRAWGAEPVDFQTATLIQERLEAARARITTPQRDWLLAAYPLDHRPLHTQPPVVAVAVKDRTMVGRLQERGIVASVATPDPHDKRVRLTLEAGLPLVRTLLSQPPLLDFRHAHVKTGRHPRGLE